MQHYDVLVIGGGTGGLVTASGCARLGRRVALIEREALGGDCLWTGCVPTKALVATARVAHQMRHADRWGLGRVEPAIDSRAVLASMREQRRLISRHDDPEKFRALGVDVIEGEARLTGGLEVAVGERRLAAKDIVLATGSRTAVPPIAGLGETGFLDHASFLAQDSLPASVAILGGGAIGVEFGQIFARLGSRVTIVEAVERILIREDPAVSAAIHAVLEAEGIEILTGHTALSARADGSTRVLTVEAKEGGARRDIAAEAIFVASGRRGNIEGLGLEEAGVKTERSWIVVDRYLRTTAPRIWACGDIHGGMQFTHVAGYEAVKIVRNMLFPGKSAADYTNVPSAVYSDPEAAHLGMTEPEARQFAGDRVRIHQVPFADVDRAVVDRGPAGFVKLVCDARGAILGAHVVGTNASTVIEEIVLARRRGMRVGELAQRISAYPSLSDGVQKAAALHYQEAARGWLGSMARRVAAWSQ